MSYTKVVRSKLEILPGIFTPHFTIHDCRDHVVAQAQLALSRNGGGVHGHLEDVWVSAEHRGLGLATVLVSEVASWAKENSLYKLTLTCRPDLVVLYEKTGFVKRSGEESVVMRQNL